MRRYYEAYEDRYKTIHAMGQRWSGETPTPVVEDVIRRYGLSGAAMLEIGCGEGRDAIPLLRAEEDLLATDASAEAVTFCRSRAPEFAERFAVLDCLRDRHGRKYGFIYAVAVIHMLVEDQDRRGFYRFIRDHLLPDGLALICTMGNGETEYASDVSEAFALREREHPSGPVRVAATSCRMVSFPAFREELTAADLRIAEEGIASSPPDFDSLMYALVCPSADR